MREGKGECGGGAVGWVRGEGVESKKKNLASFSLVGRQQTLLRAFYRTSQVKVPLAR